MHRKCQRVFTDPFSEGCNFIDLESVLELVAGEFSLHGVFLLTGRAFLRYFVLIRGLAFRAVDVVPSALCAVWWQVKTQVLLLRLYEIGAPLF